jgi:hypothetical protein
MMEIINIPNLLICGSTFSLLIHFFISSHTFSIEFDPNNENGNYHLLQPFQDTNF